jgi:hypothetical protein
LVLFLAGKAPAAINIEWTDGDSSNHLWTSPDNWNRREVPDGDYAAFIRGSAAVEATSPIIEAGIAVNVVWVIVNEGNSDYTSYLRMTGGTVSTTNFLIAWDAAAVGGVEGVFNMSGGTVDASSLQIGPGGGSGRFNLAGGTFSTGTMSMSSTCLLNVSAGTLVVNGNAVSEIQGYIDSGLISAYDGFGGTLHLDYDATNKGKTTLTAISLLNPNPADGGLAAPGALELSWTLPDPCTPGQPVNVDVYFTDDYDAMKMFTDPEAIRVVSQQSVTSVVVQTQPKTQYYWAVDTYLGGDDPNNNPFFGPIFSFYADNQPPQVDTGEDIVTWLPAGPRTVPLDATVTDDDAYTVQWTVVSEPHAGSAVVETPTAEDTSIILSAVGRYVLQLEAFDGEYTGSDTVTIGVFSDRCEAAQSQPDYEPLLGDLNGDCRVDEVDLALLQENLGQDSSLTEDWVFGEVTEDWVFGEVELTTCLFVSESSTAVPDPRDEILIGYLEDRYVVNIATGDDVKAHVYSVDDFKAYDFVFVSESVSSSDTKDLKGAPVPIFYTELWASKWDVTGWVPTNESGTYYGNTTVDETVVKIIDGDHPLAAGFATGAEITVVTDSENATDYLTYSVPQVDHIPIATLAADENKVVVMGVEAGTVLYNEQNVKDGSLTTAARCAAVGINANANNFLTDDAFTLIQAGIDWILADGN